MVSREKDQGRKKIVEVKTFVVPFVLGEIKENISISTNSNTQVSKEQIINQAFKFHLEGNISEASKYYKYFISQGFKDERVFSNYGVILNQLGRSQEAEIFYREAIKIKPDYAEAHSNLGIILRNIGKLQEAELSIRKAIEIKSNYAEAHYNLAIILNDLGKSQEAELSSRRAIKIKPDYAEAHSNLGIILNDLGKLKEAELSTRKAIKIKPDYAEAHSNLGIILNDLGKSQEAELSTRRAIEYKPELAKAYSNLGLILRDIGELTEAELSTRKAIELKPDFADAYLSMGNILNNLGKREEAIIYRKKAVELKPQDEKSIIALAHNLCYVGKNELALKYLSKNKSNACQSLYLGCLLSLDREKEFNEKYKELYKNKACNADIGAILQHANIIYGKQYEQPFCNEAIKYIFMDKINEKSFSEKHLNELISYGRRRKKEDKSQGLLKNGIQTSGNLFSLDYPFIEAMKKVLETKIEKYKQKFKDSGQGFITNWPENYELRSWIISMKTGGFLKSHNHEYGWITGSFYLQIPKYDKDNESGNIAFSYQGPRYPNKDKNFNLTIKKIETRNICIFPSSLFHHTIPFESAEDRICFVFDLIQKE